MTFRARIKRVLTFGDSSSDDNDTPRKGNPFRTRNKDPRYRDPNVWYQPGEKMPPLKYRRPVNPEHKATLESFSWNNAWRRRSIVSQYSPMGSRLPSRRASRTTVGRLSIDRRSVDAKSLRGNDDAAVDSGFGGSISTDPVDDVQEHSDEENDVRNVGLSRVPTRDPRRSSSIHSSDIMRSSDVSLDTTSDSFSVRRTKSVRSPEPHFTPEELASALRRSHLETMEERSDESGKGSPGNINLITPTDGACLTPGDTGPIEIQKLPESPGMELKGHTISVSA